MYLMAFQFYGNETGLDMGLDGHIVEAGAEVGVEVISRNKFSFFTCVNTALKKK